MVHMFNQVGRRDHSPRKRVMVKLSNTKLIKKCKNHKESPWAWITKCFHHGRGRVTSVEISKEWSLDLSNLFIGQKFSHGAHSHLYQGIYKEEPVAVKIVRVPHDEQNGTLTSLLETQFMREVTFLPRLNHQNVVKFKAACKDNHVYCILTEYLQGGSLRAYLNTLESKPMSLQKVIAFALDIARGMEYIHSQGIIHRDLKPENVLIGEDSHLKIADFGIACEAAKKCDSLSGTYRWMAPEMIKGKLHYGRKVDVYSFGLMLCEMVTGTVPYESMTPIQVAFAVSHKNSRPVIPSNCPSVMGDLIQQCWALKPEKRPEFWQVVQVLEQFDHLLAIDGSLNLVRNPCSRDHHHKKEFLHWIQRIGHVHQIMAIL